MRTTRRRIHPETAGENRFWAEGRPRSREFDRPGECAWSRYNDPTLRAGLSKRERDERGVITGEYEKRLNRFVMRVQLPETGETVMAYCPNTSRLIGLLEPGTRVGMTRNHDPNRKTNYTVRRMRNNGVWVGIEASRANDLFERHLESCPDPPFDQWQNWSREVRFESSQIDFRAAPQGAPHWVEVKSLSSRQADPRGDFAFYSGTPSRRASRHLEHLGELSGRGDRTHCVFVVQRPDVVALRPGSPTDPGWLQSLRRARDRGVEIQGFRCSWSDDGLEITDSIPAYLE